jgi:hypothetical protein
MSEVVSFGRDPALGTLMWIGDPALPEFQDAFHYCVANVAQLAIRKNFDDAQRQPAANVYRILVVQLTQQAVDGEGFGQLTDLYPDALSMSLVGTLCEGMGAPSGSSHRLKRHAWHRWNQLLPSWLGVTGEATESVKPARSSVAVVTATYAAAEALMDLAESAGATAIWCRGADTHRVRNVDVVWWDDSVAKPTSSRQWRERIAAFASAGRNLQHAWIVQTPRLDERREAINGGIDVVVSKPHLIDCLLETLQTPESTSTVQSSPIRRAA